MKICDKCNTKFQQPHHNDEKYNYCPYCGSEVLSPKFPKRVTMYLHSCKETNWETGEEIGLSEDAIKNHFAYALYELEVEIEVNENGTYRILGVKDD